MKLTYLLDGGYLLFDITIRTDHLAAPMSRPSPSENMQRFSDYARVINEAVNKEALSERRTDAEITGIQRRDRALKLRALEQAG